MFSHLHWAGWVALLLSLGVCWLMAQMAVAVRSLRDDSDKWEGIFALAMGALISVAPLWLLQLIFTLVASLASHWEHWWLWAWLFGVLVLPTLPPVPQFFESLARSRAAKLPKVALAATLTTAVSTTLAAPPPPPVPLEKQAQLTMMSAWPKVKGDGWQPRLTAGLPGAWPPPSDGVVVWYCYADRGPSPLTPDASEIAAPWARITWPPGAAEPHLEMLGEGVQAFGLQGVRPLRADELSQPPPKKPLSETIRDFQGADLPALAAMLEQWRAYRGRIASHPLIAKHLPPSK